MKIQLSVLNKPTVFCGLNRTAYRIRSPRLSASGQLE